MLNSLWNVVKFAEMNSELRSLKDSSISLLCDFLTWSGDVNSTTEVAVASAFPTPAGVVAVASVPSPDARCFSAERSY